MGSNPTPRTILNIKYHSPGIEDAVAFGDHFGSSLTTGDFNEDGYSDLAMGQPFYDISPVFFEFHLIGAVTALYGSASVLGDEQVWHQDVANVEDAADDEMFGAAV